MSGSDLAKEKAFQQEIAEHLEAHGWLHSPTSAGYDKQRALFPEDVLGWLATSDLTWTSLGYRRGFWVYRCW
ncbi:hypothetical protein [Brachybacterium sp. UMB0905]|uniref:hypothetical protein n=1 Tax=Brachybacterium sp. UMB0905 TaxID=2069310 RepID=UPI000C8101A1|nr:hypothetical protein [Brachybacterium sp. UMB0905]PMC74204.1 hypothetical protein CJ197_14780 [Brachybacterium sp. UMB0905]